MVKLVPNISKKVSFVYTLSTMVEDSAAEIEQHHHHHQQVLHEPSHNGQVKQ